MARKGMFSGSGIEVETVVHQPNVHPGTAITGQVLVTGGGKERVVERVAVALVSRVEVEGRDREFATTIAFAQQPVWGSFALAPGTRYALDFSIDTPWEAPITVLGGAPLRGMFVGVQTEVEVARAVDKGDLDQVHVHPLPAQAGILDALLQLGFRLRGADLEMGRITGSTMPFYQEIEFLPSPAFGPHMSELEVTFLAGPATMDVVLEADNRGGLGRAGGDTYSRFRVEHLDADRIDWPQHLQQQLQQLASRRGWR